MDSVCQEPSGANADDLDSEQVPATGIDLLKLRLLYGQDAERTFSRLIAGTMVSSLLTAKRCCLML